MQWIVEKNGYTFAWDIGTNSATLTGDQTGKLVWQGTLLPAFDIIHQNERVFQKARAVAAELSETGGIIHLELDGLWRGNTAACPNSLWMRIPPPRRAMVRHSTCADQPLLRRRSADSGAARYCPQPQ